MFILLVTWLTVNQPPMSYQVTFSDEASCNIARGKLVAEGERLRQEEEQYRARIHAANPVGIPPKVVVICTKQ
jgi:hypothetical protein